jgi:hypothetical protein
VVCAPGRTDRAPGDRVKTDKRDAIRLARLLAAGEHEDTLAVELAVLVRLDAVLLPGGQKVAPALCHPGQPVQLPGEGPSAITNSMSG